MFRSELNYLPVFRCRLFLRLFDLQTIGEIVMSFYTIRMLADYSAEIADGIVDISHIHFAYAQAPARDDILRTRHENLLELAAGFIKITLSHHDVAHFRPYVDVVWFESE